MQIGIGLPATIPGVTAPDILEWARLADTGPFSSLGIIDRLVYSNFEPLITLATVAGATQRIRLMPSVLLAPLRSGAVLAKEAATLDALSGGRLTLGLGVGSRALDFDAAGTAFAERSRRFDEQLATMKRVWAGEPMSAYTGPIGPAPAQQGGPPLLIAGFGPAAMRRVAQWGDGYIGTLVDPATASQIYAQALSAWQAASRTGRPRFVMGLYYALGSDAAERGGAYLHDYYAFDPQMAPLIAGSILATPEAITEAIRAYSDVGVDEINFWPTIADIDQQHRLAEVVGSGTRS
jgi:alkanesulfonate monooxygenase SsuD/methylene tetrahydromethanopterin reductase-like flavin-dependent oxidoreductase (luciferase family)